MNLIDRQMAIDAIYAEFEYVYCYNCDHEGNEEWCEDCHRKYMKWSASRDTIERVLNDLPSAQSEERTKERTETHECDLVSRQAVIDTVAKSSFDLNDPDENWIMQDWIKEIPSAQPELIEKSASRTVERRRA